MVAWKQRPVFVNAGHILLLIVAKYQANLCEINQLQSSTCKTGFKALLHKMGCTNTMEDLIKTLRRCVSLNKSPWVNSVFKSPLHWGVLRSPCRLSGAHWSRSCNLQGSQTNTHAGIITDQKKRRQAKKICTDLDMGRDATARFWNNSKILYNLAGVFI